MIKLIPIKELPEFKYDYGEGSQAPVIGNVNSGYADIWFSYRDSNGESRPGTYTLDLIDYKVTHQVALHMKDFKFAHGVFYENGVMPSQIVNQEMMFTGWSRGYEFVPYRNSLGKYHMDAGIVYSYWDRDNDEPIGLSMGFQHINDLFYMSFGPWSKKESIYSIKSVTLRNGNMPDKSTIKTILKGQYAYAKPWVTFRTTPTGRYRELWYSYRAFDDFRTNPKNSYKLGVLREINGEWYPQNLDTSELPESLMQAYPAVLDNLLLYNNSFTGAIQLARIEDVE